MKNFSKLWWFSCGALAGLSTLSIAMGSVPSRSRITDDTAIYQNLSEIRVKREGRRNFDRDIKQLVALEDQYREKLPRLNSLNGPMKRISAQGYKYSGGKKAAKRSHQR
jgi:hypothetical protein